MQHFLIVRGIVMGFALAIPVGPICLLCIHRALAGGWLTAFLSTLGAVMADCILGAAVGLGSSVIAPLVEHEQTPLRVVGGLFMIAVGLRSAYASPSIEPEARKNSIAREFSSSFLITMFNPANLLGVLGVFAAVGTFRTGELASIEALAVLILGVAAGSSVWWLVLSVAAGAVGKRFTRNGVVWLNRISAVFLALLGVAIMASALLGHPA
jgi:threonine/homoserine/homoserine lactone efflux protein